MEFIIYLLGVIFGSVFANILFYLKTSTGTLKIDHSNPEKDMYRFEIYDLDTLDKKKRIILKIDHDADFSQE